MGDSDGGAALGGGVEGRLDDLLRLRVQSGRGFIKEQDLGITKEGAGDGNALFLSTRQERAFATADGVERLTVFGILATSPLSLGGGVLTEATL